MNWKCVATTAAVVSAIVFVWEMSDLETSHQEMSEDNDGMGSVIHSSYAGEELRGIKSLSQADVEGLLAGEGTPFGGMAKAGELNGYPGPRHVLDAVEAGELTASDEQYEQIKNIYEEMKSEAVALGEKIIATEEKLDDEFINGTVTADALQELVEQSADLYAQLRFVHLQYHLRMVDILSSEQVAKYNTLRGYVGNGDPCDAVPEGHDPEMWKLHNGCN